MAKRATARKAPGTAGRNIELYRSAYRLALNHMSPVQKYRQPTLVLRLHASIRRQIDEGARDPLSIAAEALKDVYETNELERPMGHSRELALKKIQEYLQHAAECREMARTASAAHRQQLEQMAETWEQLAPARQRQLHRMSDNSDDSGADRPQESPAHQRRG